MQTKKTIGPCIATFKLCGITLDTFGKEKTQK
jgi:hypothetical protein